MLTVSNPLFETAILAQPAPRCAAAKTAVRAAASPVAGMPVSLWRHTQNEDATGTRHHCLARRVFAGMAVLSLGSGAYAIHQTCALLSGSHFHDTIAAFLR